MDYPELIRFSNQLNLRYNGISYDVEKDNFKCPDGAICFEDSYLYRDVFYSFKTNETLYHIQAMDIYSSILIDRVFMLYYTLDDKCWAINTSTFEVMNFYDHVKKYKRLIISTRDEIKLSYTHMLRVMHYNGENCDLPLMEVSFKTLQYEITATAYKNVIAVFGADNIVIVSGAKYTMREMPSTTHDGETIRIFYITGLGKHTKAAARDSDF